jgi:signal transduction histidine kinase
MDNQPLREQGQPKVKRAYLRSPVWLFLIVAISITVAETAIMFLFEQLPPMPSLVKNIMDGVLLTILLFPVLYLFFFQPLKMHMAALQQAEGSPEKKNGEQAGWLKTQVAISHSPVRNLLVMAISIMVGETSIMFLFEQLPPMPPSAENFADGFLLTILLFPILYLFLLRPLRVHVAALGQAEKSLRQQNEELKEKTLQLIAAQEDLVRKEKLAVLGQVVGCIGHELRNPLGVMSNAVYFLQTVLPAADETTREYLNIIKDEIANANRIVTDLLDSVRSKPPHPEAVGVRKVIERILHQLTIPDSVSVRLDIPEALPALLVDAMQIKQVFRNLISNGVEAMPGGGALEIRALENKPDGTITVSVRDSGSGMTPEQLGKLFQPLFTTKARGIGLGLVVVKNLIEANGGTVEVQSEAGKGSMFSIVLPAAQ